MHRAINGYFFTAAVTTKFEYGETMRNSESLKMGLCFRNDRKSLKSDLQLPSKLILTFIRSSKSPSIQIKRKAL